MLFRVGTHHLDFNRAYLCPARHAHPSIAGEPKWIDRIRDHGLTETEILFGERITDTIPSVVKGLASHSRFPDRLLNRVNA